MAYVAAQAADGSFRRGSAFHVGEGVFVTARHVVENLRIIEVAAKVGQESKESLQPSSPNELVVKRNFPSEGWGRTILIDEARW